MEPFDGERSAVALRFQTAWSEVIGTESDPAPELLPTLLARAAAITLAADGAGVSILDGEHRVPLGASNESAVVAERLQFTIGEGPCLDALATSRALRVDEDQIRADWPPYHAELIRSTPFRSIVAVPLTFTATLHGALDVYFADPVMAAYTAVTDAVSVAHDINAMLAYAGSTPDDGMRWGGAEMPSWMYGPQARQRLRVWIAVGIVMFGRSTPGPDALAAIRAYSYGHEESLETICDAVIDGRLQPRSLV